MRYAYFPGCSLSRTARAYDLSTRAVADALEIELEEIEDWNCCGATEYISLNKTAAYALIAGIISTSLFLSGPRFEAAAASHRVLALLVAILVAFWSRRPVLGMLAGTLLVLVLPWLR